MSRKSENELRAILRLTDTDITGSEIHKLWQVLKAGDSAHIAAELAVNNSNTTLLTLIQILDSGVKMTKRVRAATERVVTYEIDKMIEEAWK